MVKDKVVIVTGGAGLIGREFIEAVAGNNGIAVIADIDEKCSKQIINSNQENRVEFHFLDISSKNSINDLIVNIKQKYGKIDAWVNNAYVNPTQGDKNKKKREYGNSFFDYSFEDLSKSISLNIGGYFLCSQQISSFFLEQGFGNIINISSIYGVNAPKFQIYENTKMTSPIDYAITKSSMIHFTKYLAKYLKGNNIRVNCISPGGVYNEQPSEFIDAYNKFGVNKGMLDRKDVTGALLFLISDLSQFINGQNIIVDDGWSL